MTDLPRGTVTFLFTDIEGSTALWERDRQVMAAAVERHIALLDTAIQTHGGMHFKTVGDAVQAAFPTAPAAGNVIRWGFDMDAFSPSPYMCWRWQAPRQLRSSRPAVLERNNERRMRAEPVALTA